MRIYLDVHGTLCDLVGAYLFYLEKENVVWPKGVYDFKEAIGQPLQYMPFSFWANLPLMKDVGSILNPIMEKPAPVILISRSMDSSSALGTHCWCAKYFPDLPFITTPYLKGETLDVNEDMILIDDCDMELAAWHGPTIRVSRPWNCGEGDIETTLREELARMVK